MRCHIILIQTDTLEQVERQTRGYCTYCTARALLVLLVRWSGSEKYMNTTTSREEDDGRDWFNHL